MKEINTEIKISSPPNKVWEALMDLENWSKWKPVVNNIHGKLSIGGQLSITMSDSKGNPAKKYKAVITELKKNERFSFIATMMGKFIFSAERTIELKTINKETILISEHLSQKNNFL